MSQFKLLVNPTSGNGLGQAILQTPLDIPAQATDPTNIKQQLESFLNAGDTLIIAGGDGTLSLVLNGIYKTELYNHISIALYPLGTGNDFAKALAIPKLPIKEYLCKLKSSSTIVNIPLWLFNDHIFINYISWGIGAKIIADVNKWRRYLPHNKALTKLLYFISGLINFICLPKFELSTTHENLISLIFCNINFYGGGCYLGDEQSNDQKQLNCFMLTSRLDFVKMVLSRLSKKPISENKKLTSYNATLKETYLQIDGEPQACTPGIIRCAGAISITLIDS